MKQTFKMALLKDFPTPPENHEDNKIKRSLILGGRKLAQIEFDQEKASGLI